MSNIVNNVGTITADVAANCAAALGANTVVLKVTNGTTGQSSTANLTVNVTANSPPVLTYANPPGVVFGQGGTVNPATGPSDNGTISTIAVQSTGTFTGIVSVNNSTGVVSFSNSAPVGNSTITIRATDNCAATTDAPFTITVSKANTTTALVSGTNPSVSGKSVTFTATVTTVAPGLGSPTGTVNFLDGATPLASNVALNGAGVATFTTTSLSIGTHSITAVYSSDANFNASTSPAVSQVVNKASTTTALTSSANPTAFGQSTIFTATVAAVVPGSGTPTGTVTFLDGATTLGTGTLNGAGVATFGTSTLSVGSHTITASYAGDANFLASVSSPLTQTVNKATTASTVVSSVNPSVFGQTVIFTATVVSTAPPIAPAGTVTKSVKTALSRTRVVKGKGSPSSVGVLAVPGPTGTVTFFDGATNIGTGTLNASGQATLSTGALAVGTHTITVSYGGDANYLTSTSAAITQTVNKSNSTTIVVSSANPSVFGQPVTLTATVSATAPGAGVPTGSVTFMDGAVILGTVNLNGSGQAAIATSAFAVGVHSITVTYPGDANFNASTSAVLLQTVNKAATTTVITTSANPSAVGSTVTLTATVVPTIPGAGVPNRHRSVQR